MWFNPERLLYKQTRKRKKIFVHISDLENSGLKSLADNQAVTFDISEDKGRKSAKNIKLA